MHTYKDLGRSGRLGNQLFQIAATIGTAVARNDLYVFPKWPYDNKIDVPVMETKYFSDIKWVEEHEGDFTYNSAFSKPATHQNNVTLMGYFQSEKYFKHCKDLIINCILTKASLDHRKQLITSYPSLNFDNTCCLHVRRGDYMYLQTCYIDLATTTYYNSAISHMLAQGVKQFIVFSDDIPWCRSVFLLKYPNLDITLSKCSVDFDDMLLMSACSHHIIANSSFSWWGSYLADSKLTIAPKQWFGPSIKHNTRDLYRENMIQL
jgi:hypothetical protein